MNYLSIVAVLLALAVHLDVGHVPHAVRARETVGVVLARVLDGLKRDDVLRGAHVFKRFGFGCLNVQRKEVIRWGLWIEEGRCAKRSRFV